MAVDHPETAKRQVIFAACPAHLHEPFALPPVGERGTIDVMKAVVATGDDVRRVYLPMRLNIRRLPIVALDDFPMPDARDLRGDAPADFLYLGCQDPIDSQVDAAHYGAEPPLQA